MKIQTLRPAPVSFLVAALLALALAVVAPPPAQAQSANTPRLSVASLGVGNAALAYVDAATVQIVDRDTGAVPSATNPVAITIGGQMRTVTAAVTAAFAGCLDTGAEAAGTQYFVWATRDAGATGFTLKCSASATTPTGLTTKLLLGSFHNGPSSDILPNSVWSLARGERGYEGMVKVGEMWVDIYEMSVYNSATYGSGTQKGSGSDDYGCADHAGDCSSLYAQSRYNVTPSRYMSWFQAARFCLAAGKHLITDVEWQGQALGTPDVQKSVSSLTSVGTTATATINSHGYGGNGTTVNVFISGAAQAEYNGARTVTVTGTNTVTYTFAGSATSPATGTIIALTADCNILTSGPEGTGTRTACKSWANTYDNVGNVWEWTGSWFAGTLASASPASESPGASKSWSPGLFDTVWNVRGAAYADGNGGGYTDGIPAAPIRGGSWADAGIAGVFSLGLSSSPWRTDSYIGGRCARQ